MVSSEEGTAFGAALLASTGAGVYKSVKEACQKTIRITEKVSPGPASNIYEKLYEEYRLLYPSLKGTFHRMPDILSLE